MLENFFAARSSQCSVTEAVPPITLLSGPRSWFPSSHFLRLLLIPLFDSFTENKSVGRLLFCFNSLSTAPWRVVVMWFSSATRGGWSTSHPFCLRHSVWIVKPISSLCLFFPVLIPLFFLKSLFLLFQDGDPPADVLERIEMKYIEDYDGMTKYFAAFHLHKTFPVAIIIDDFEDHFIDRTCKQRYGNARGRDLAMARCLALCRDAILHANQKLEAQASCKLLFADTHQGDNPRLLFIYKRWVHCILTIHGDVYGFFILKNSNVSSNALETRRAKYSIALQSLLLEEILESPAKSDEQSLPVVR